MSVFYGIDCVNKLNLSKKQETTVYFNQKTKHEIIDCDMYVYLDGPSINFGTLIYGKIVSIATWNEFKSFREIINGRRDNVIEIGIGTNIHHRQKGYAVSNVVALCEFILKIKAVDLVYACTQDDNICSQKTMESAGMFLMSEDEIYERNCRK